MQTSKEHDEMAKSNVEINPGRVKQICQNFLLHSDSGLAHRLQEEEFAEHFDRNRTHRRESRMGVKTARDIEKEEEQTFVAKQFDFYQQKQKLEEDDVVLAQQLQEELKNQSNVTDQIATDPHYHTYHDQSFYEEIDQLSVHEDTSSDEQLAQMLQEEEQLLSLSTRHSSIRSTPV